MTATTTVVTMQGAVLPADSALARDYVLPADRHTDAYLAGYDRRTVVYDLAQAPGGQGLIMTCPRLFNLWPALRQALPDGALRGPWARQRLRTSEHLRLRMAGASVPLTIGGHGMDVPVRPDLSAGFAGTNALLLMNKDNALDWIRAWATFNVRAHGADAVVAFDNGSTAYSAQDLADCLASVPGLRQVAVFAAPFPFGPKVKRYKRQSSKFLQNALMNMARLTVLARARAVLNSDPDEVILPKADVTVFDAAVHRRHRFVKITGSWVNPAASAQWPCMQADHVWRHDPDKSCHDKWCAVPAGALSRCGWDWHKVGDEVSRLFRPDPRFEMLHCRATTTGWKRQSANSQGQALQHDPQIEAAFARWLG